jgi:hypothetical protein
MTMAARGNALEMVRRLKYCIKPYFSKSVGSVGLKVYAGFVPADRLNPNSSDLGLRMQ